VTGKASISFRASHDGQGVLFKCSAVGHYNPSVKQDGAGSPAIGHKRNGVLFH
jgi:hypothetical protein